MATRPNRDLKIGEIIDKTMGVLSLSALPSLAFIVVIGGLSGGLDIFGKQLQQPGVIPNMGMVMQVLALALLIIVLAFIGGYLLLESMLKRTGLMNSTGDKRIVAYIGMSLLSGLAIIGGLLLVVIPGLIFMARWSLSGPLLIGRGEKVFASLGKSWAMTKGHEFGIVVSLLIVLVVFNGIGYLPNLLLGTVPPVLAIVARLASTAGTAVISAMYVAIYGILSTRDVSGTFS
ncbi:MAG: hypothetical protein J7496_08100 [Novosphingobium sp.]|nr:hypothetical protein [Novosphingobium sp.]